jgi:DivIVA domain-containing protein
MWGRRRRGRELEEELRGGSGPARGEVRGSDPTVPRLTPRDVQEKQFHLAFRGYNEREVDEFLDLVTEELARLHAENRRLREELEARGGAAVPQDPEAAARRVREEAEAAARRAREEAEAAVRRAREEAARIVAEAEARAREVLAAARGSPAPAVDDRRAAAPGGRTAERRAGGAEGRAGGAGRAGGVPPEVAVLLAREKEFLRALAGLIQSHADGLRQEVRRLRAAAAPGAGPGGEAPAATPGGPVGTGAATAAVGGPGPLEVGEPGPSVPSEARTSEPGAPVRTEASAPGGAGPREPRAGAGSAGPGGPAHAPGPGEPPSEGPPAGQPSEGPPAGQPSEGPPGAGPAGESPAAPRPWPGPADDEGDEDRSLRELFWGED